MKPKNTLPEILSIDYPFVQAPMLGVTTPEMVAAISNEGALGSLPIGGLPPTQALALIQKTKKLTNRPFAVNLFANAGSAAIDEDVWNQMQALIEKFCARYEVPYERQSLEARKFFSYEDQVGILCSENIPVVSFTFGVLSDETINRLHQHRVSLIGTATSFQEASLLADKGIDIITAQGIEAGGHRGTFLHEEIPQVGLMALLPQIVDAVDKPVLAAGAIADGRAIKAAMILGAAGVVVGSAFVGCHESAANARYKEVLQQGTDTSTTLTKSYTGRWFRVINNEFIHTVESSGLAVNQFQVQQLLTSFLRTLHQHKNAEKFLPMPAGQNVRKTTAVDAATILRDLLREAEWLHVEQQS
jgi:nitronate monooxygenase